MARTGFLCLGPCRRKSWPFGRGKVVASTHGPLVSQARGVVTREQRRLDGDKAKVRSITGMDREPKPWPGAKASR